MVGDGETFLACEMVGEVFVYLGEPGEPDERNDCPLSRSLVLSCPVKKAV